VFHKVTPSLTYAPRAASSRRLVVAVTAEASRSRDFVIFALNRWIVSSRWPGYQFWLLYRTFWCPRLFQIVFIMLGWCTILECYSLQYASKKLQNQSFTLFPRLAFTSFYMKRVGVFLICSLTQFCIIVSSS
jgi:hypothetical protein